MVINWILNIGFQNSICSKINDLLFFGKLDLSGFQKEENKYMYIPMNSGHIYIF